MTVHSAFIRAHREEILRVVAEHGGRSVRVFGSMARGEAGADSDLDLLVDLPPGTSLLDHAGLIVELSELLGRDVDVGSEADLRKRLRDRILVEAVPL